MLAASPEEAPLTRVAIRVAVFGDRPFSERILTQVQARLGNPGSVQPAPLNLVGPLCQELPVKVRRARDEVPQALALAIEVAPVLEDVRHGGAEDTAPDAGLGRVAVPLLRLAPVRVAKEAPLR